MSLSRAALKAYFQTGYKPTQSQFSDLIDAMFNLNDDTIAMANITGLTAARDGKASAAALTSLANACAFFQALPLAAGTASFLVPAGTLIEKLIVFTPATEITFKIGTTAGNNDLLDSIDIPVGYKI